MRTAHSKLGLEYALGGAVALATTGLVLAKDRFDARTRGVPWTPGVFPALVFAGGAWCLLRGVGILAR